MVSVVCSNIVGYIDTTVRTGHVVSVVCFVSWWCCGSNIFHKWVLGSIGLYIQGMWSVLCVPYVGVGI